VKYAIFTALVLISARAYYGISHGDETWVLWLAISFFWAYLSYASFKADEKRQKIYVIQILGFVVLSIILFAGTFIVPQLYNSILIAYILIYVAILVRYGGINIVMQKFRRK
jgi:hypothetical protein